MSTPRRVPDDLWAEIETLLPTPPSRERGGRTRADDRTLLNGMLYILWTGAPWRAMPNEFGPWQTSMIALPNGSAAGCLKTSGDAVYTSTTGNTALTGSGKQVTAHTCGRRLRGKECGPNPTDRAKAGLKDHVLSDGRGVPLSVVVTAANVNDGPMLQELLADRVAVRPQPTTVEPQHLCLDAA